MQNYRLSFINIFFVLNIFTLGSVFGETIENLPPEKMQGSISYVTGGVGYDEAIAMRKAEPMYPLSLEFVQHAKPKDEFLANVEVTIKNHAGEIALQVISEGPFLLARLPPGKYVINAKIKDELRTQHVTLIEKKPAHFIFEWK